MTSPLSPAVIADLKRQLQERQNQLLQELGEAQASTLEIARADDAREVTDQKDLAEEVDAATLRDAEASRDHQELLLVRAALARIDDDRYGICLACEEPIPEQRLRAQPAAARCLPCQSEYEAKRLR